MDTPNIPLPGEVVETDEQAHAILSGVLGDNANGLAALYLDSEGRGIGVVVVEDATVEDTDEVLTQLGMVGAEAGLNSLVAWHPGNPDKLIEQFCMELPVGATADNG